MPPVASPSMTETPAEQTVAPTSPTPATSSSAGTDAGKAAPEKGLFGDEKVDLTSTIKAILAGEKQNMVFQLANDQIWMQATPRPLPFKVGDTVTIKNANLGGYFMRSTKGTSTRVQRIH